MQEKGSIMVVWCKLKILSLGITVTLVTKFSIRISQPLKIHMVLNCHPPVSSWNRHSLHCSIPLSSTNIHRWSLGSRNWCQHVYYHQWLYIAVYHYQVQVYTGDHWAAGTDANMYITINDFTLQYTTIKYKCIPVITGQRELMPTCILPSMTLHCSIPLSSTSVHRWSLGSGNWCQHVYYHQWLYIAVYHYQVQVYTDDHWAAGTDANMYITINDFTLQYTTIKYKCILVITGQRELMPTCILPSMTLHCSIPLSSTSVHRWSLGSGNWCQHVYYHQWLYIAVYHYQVQVYTGDHWAAGTDANMYITINDFTLQYYQVQVYTGDHWAAGTDANMYITINDFTLQYTTIKYKCIPVITGQRELMPTCILPSIYFTLQYTSIKYKYTQVISGQRELMPTCILPSIYFTLQYTSIKYKYTQVISGQRELMPTCILLSIYFTLQYTSIKYKCTQVITGQRELMPTYITINLLNIAVYHYQVQVYTGDHWAAGTDANIYITINLLYIAVYHYQVQVYTGDHWAAGTDANMYITINGTKGDSGKRLLYKCLNNRVKFKRGQVETRILFWLLIK